MKTVLILVLSAEEAPYGKMLETSINTWDSFEVDGVETLYYCGNGNKYKGNPKVIYTHVQHTYGQMGEKTIRALEYVLKNKSFDYIARVNSSTYVDKKKLIDYVQTLPDSNLFCGAEVLNVPKKWCWGGYQFIYSRDVVEKIVDNKHKWNHREIEDVSISYLVSELGIPYYPIKHSCSINKAENQWLCLSCTNDNFYFSNFGEINNYDNVFYRIKQDYDRDKDEYLMNELFNVLK